MRAPVLESIDRNKNQLLHCHVVREKGGGKMAATENHGVPGPDQPFRGEEHLPEGNPLRTGHKGS